MVLELRIENNDSLPHFPIIHQEYFVDMHLFEHDVIKCGLEISLNVSVISVDDAGIENSSFLTNLIDIVENKGIQKNGSAKVSIRFKQLSMEMNKSKFILVFTSNSPFFPSVRSIPMYCVNYRLFVTEEFTSNYVWYKDEGGKDKCIEINVSLRDASGLLVCNEHVDLGAKLNYCNGEQVLDQDILVVSHDSKRTIDEHGNASIKFRINEVSNRHRGNLFQLVIFARTRADISPALCTPVDVKSKRNTLNKHKLPSDNHAHTSSVSNKKIKAEQHEAAAALHDQNNSATHEEPSFTRSISQQSSNLNSRSIQPEPVFLNCSSLGLNTNPSTASIMLNDPSISINSCTENIINWTKNVMKTMEYLQWWPIGMEASMDRTAIPDRPLYNIINPEPSFRILLDEYNRSVRDSLIYLKNYNEPSSSLLLTSSAGAGAGGLCMNRLRSFDPQNDFDDIDKSQLLNAYTSNNAYNNNIILSSRGGGGSSSSNSSTSLSKATAPTPISSLDLINAGMIKPPSITNDKPINNNNNNSYYNMNGNGITNGVNGNINAGNINAYLQSSNSNSIGNGHGNGHMNVNGNVFTSAASVAAGPSAITTSIDEIFRYLGGGGGNGGGGSSRYEEGLLNNSEASDAWNLVVEQGQGAGPCPGLGQSQGQGKSIRDSALAYADFGGGCGFGGSGGGEGGGGGMELLRTNSLYLDSSFNAAPNTAASFGISSAINSDSFDFESFSQESNVYYILAESYDTLRGSLGLPAFNFSRLLLGFYRENKVSPRKKFIQFHPLKSSVVIDDKIITNTQDNLTRHLKERSGAVFTVENETFLQKQKEKAFVYALENDLSD